MYVLFFIYASLLCGFTWKFFRTSLTLKTSSTTGADIMLWPIQLFMPIGLALLGLQLLYQIYAGIKTVFLKKEGLDEKPGMVK